MEVFLKLTLRILQNLEEIDAKKAAYEARKLAGQQRQYDRAAQVGGTITKGVTGSGDSTNSTTDTD